MVCHATVFVLALLDEQLELVGSAACSARFPCRLSFSSSALWLLNAAFRLLFLAHCPLSSAFCFVFYKSLPGWVTIEQRKPAVCRPVMKPAPCSESKVVCWPLAPPSIQLEMLTLLTWSIMTSILYLINSLFDFEGQINICVSCLDSSTYRTAASKLYMLKLTEGTLLLRTLLACHGEV